MAKRAALYIRVSTDAQNTTNQELELRAAAQHAGWKIVKVYIDQGVSGGKRRDDRPAFKAMCGDAARRKFDIVAAWSVDRLSRNLHDLLSFVSELQALKIDLCLVSQGVDTSRHASLDPTDPRVYYWRDQVNPYRILLPK